MADVTFESEDGVAMIAIRWENPDGTLGGFVAPCAKIHKSVFIANTAIAGPWTDLGPGASVGPLGYVGMVPE